MHLNFLQIYSIIENNDILAYCLKIMSSSHRNYQISY